MDVSSNMVRRRPAFDQTGEAAALLAGEAGGETQIAFRADERLRHIGALELRDRERLRRSKAPPGAACLVGNGFAGLRV
jgi:hypothetical protein